MAILDRLEATLGYAHVSIEVDVNFISFLRALPHTRWGSWGAQEGDLRFSRAGWRQRRGPSPGIYLR